MEICLDILQGNPGRDGDTGPQGIQGPEVIHDLSSAKDLFFLE